MVLLISLCYTCSLSSFVFDFLFIKSCECNTYSVCLRFLISATGALDAYFFPNITLMYDTLISSSSRSPTRPVQQQSLHD